MSNSGADITTLFEDKKLRITSTQVSGRYSLTISAIDSGNPQHTADAGNVAQTIIERYNSVRNDELLLGLQALKIEKPTEGRITIEVDRDRGNKSAIAAATASMGIKKSEEILEIIARRQASSLTALADQYRRGDIAR